MNPPFGQSYNNGTCTLYSAGRNAAAVYGTPCSTVVPFGCDSSEYVCVTWLPGTRVASAHASSCPSLCSDGSDNKLTCPDAGTGKTASTCAYSQPGYGDPCVSHVDCRGSYAAASAPLMCNTAIKQCVVNASVATCLQDSECADGFFCSRDSGSCAAMTPIGGTCGVTGDWKGKCYGQGVCYNNTYVSPFTQGQVNGTCVPPNSLATGTVAYAPLGDYVWFYPSYYGFQLCATGLGVPVANASGYPTGQFKCVAAVDVSQQGASCDRCNWLNPSIGARECGDCCRGA